MTFRSGLFAARSGAQNRVAGSALVRWVQSLTVALGVFSTAVSAQHESAHAAALSASEEAALFAAAGFKLAGNGQYQRCQEEPVTLSYQPGHVELDDLNGDGRSEAWVTESSLFCYGNAGQYFLLLTEAPTGWQILLEAVGIAVIKDSDYQGWPDIEVGGPGFGDFPLYRWNGSGYGRHTP
ncbi:hypothetical protein [Marinobacterium rhizophilum]|uniref:VCBS repeat-containing protein n=1 Tax=Marinobacterium rhizophilum TaxID=420402 RepID=A0ABY5HK52_9GAMM|nr:hypothetical protein [Marinobacterium rhizophilum]UTW12762.1 hypothetical protein KDW95_03535 [Marinobacterium rhizophilum]